MPFILSANKHIHKNSYPNIWLIKQIKIPIPYSKKASKNHKPQKKPWQRSSEKKRVRVKDLRKRDDREKATKESQSCVEDEQVGRKTGHGVKRRRYHGPLLVIFFSDCQTLDQRRFKRRDWNRSFLCVCFVCTLNQIGPKKRTVLASCDWVLSFRFC